jgi:hypothetical protein
VEHAFHLFVSIGRKGFIGYMEFVETSLCPIDVAGLYLLDFTSVEPNVLSHEREHLDLLSVL